MKKPKLNVILQDSASLKIIMLDNEEIKKFYRIRSKDVAHDWGEVEPVSRKEVVECKMWAEELIVRDMVRRKKV